MNQTPATLLRHAAVLDVARAVVIPDQTVRAATDARDPGLRPPSRQRAHPAGQVQACRGIAAGHSILLAVYHILTDREPYDEHRHLPKPPRPARPEQLLEQLRALGFEVTIMPVDPAA
jgi:hypothetical protein